MGTKVGINGFGRIGRNIMRAALARADATIDFVAVNDITDPETLAHLFKYDSVLGNLDADVVVEGDGLRVGDKHFKVFSERDPAALPWGELGVDVVVESTGLFHEARRRREAPRGRREEGDHLGPREAAGPHAGAWGQRRRL